MALAMRKRGNKPPMKSFVRKSFVPKHTTQR